MIKVKGSILSNLFFGEHILDTLFPYTLLLDVSNQLITVTKRNYYIIGVDRQTIPFRNIRRVNMNSHLIGADLSIKVYGTNLIVAKCLPKKGAKLVYETILRNMSKTKTTNIS